MSDPPSSRGLGTTEDTVSDEEEQGAGSMEQGKQPRDFNMRTVK